MGCRCTFIIISIFRCGNWGTESFSNFPKCNSSVLAPDTELLCETHQRLKLMFTLTLRARPHNSNFSNKAQRGKITCSRSYSLLAKSGLKSCLALTSIFSTAYDSTPIKVLPLPKAWLKSQFAFSAKVSTLPASISLSSNSTQLSLQGSTPPPPLSKPPPNSQSMEVTHNV